MYIFIGIPRTGCDSLTHALGEIFPTSDVKSSNKPDIETLRATADLSGTSLVIGHFGLGDLDRGGLLGPNNTLFSCLRNPIQRTISTYTYAIAKAQGMMKGDPSGQDEAIARMDLQTFVEELLAPDEQLSWLSGIQADGSLDVQSCLDAIDERVDIVGITEELPRFVYLLNRMYGWNLDPYWHTNASSSSYHHAEINDAALAAIRRKNAKDIVAYEHFKRRFEVRCRSFGLDGPLEFERTRQLAISLRAAMRDVSTPNKAMTLMFAKSFFAAAQHERAVAQNATPSATEVQQCRAVLHLLGEILCNHGEDAELLALFAPTYERMGYYYASLGDDRARETLITALNIYTQLLSAEWSTDRALSMAQIALSLGGSDAAAGDANNAVAWNRRAHVIASQVLSRAPSCDRAVNIRLEVARRQKEVSNRPASPS